MTKTVNLWECSNCGFTDNIYTTCIMCAGDVEIYSVKSHKAEIAALREEANNWRTLAEKADEIMRRMTEENKDLQARLDRWNNGGNYIGTNAQIKALREEIERLKDDLAEQAYQEFSYTHLLNERSRYRKALRDIANFKTYKCELSYWDVKEIAQRALNDE